METPTVGKIRFFVIEYPVRGGPASQTEGPYWDYLSAARKRKEWARRNGARMIYQVVETDDIDTLLANANIDIE